MTVHEFDVTRRMRRAGVATYWTSHGGKTLHHFLCRLLLSAPGVEARPAMEQYDDAEIIGNVPRHRRCGNCMLGPGES